MEASAAPHGGRPPPRPGVTLTTRMWARLQAVGVPLLLKTLRGCPFALVEWLLALAGIVQGLAEPRRVRLALAWARAHGRRGPARWRLALEVLASRGRSVALAAAPIMMRPDDFNRRLRTDGLEHLRTDGPSIVLNFHLGPPMVGRALRAAGYRFVATTSGWSFVGWPKTKRSPTSVPRERIAWDDRDPTLRGVGLYRLRRALLSGRMILVTADGDSGREAFRVSVPGGEVVVRSGWWVLRRMTGAPAIPVLTRRDGSRLAVVFHPPLPGPVPDPVEDARRCAEALAPLLRDFVRRHPAQCHTLVFGFPAAPATGSPRARR